MSLSPAHNHHTYLNSSPTLEVHLNNHEKCISIALQSNVLRGGLYLPTTQSKVVKTLLTLFRPLHAVFRPSRTWRHPTHSRTWWMAWRMQCTPYSWTPRTSSGPGARRCARAACSSPTTTAGWRRLRSSESLLPCSSRKWLVHLQVHNSRRLLEHKDTLPKDCIGRCLIQPEDPSQGGKLSRKQLVSYVAVFMAAGTAAALACTLMLSCRCDVSHHMV